MKKILVVGGAGFIGSQVTLMLQERGYETIVLDNLSRGHQNAVLNGTFIRGDISDSNILNQIFSQHHVDAVMHFAALTDIGESVRDPLHYYTHNVAFTLNLLNAMKRFNVKTIIFSSSAAVYGMPQTSLIQESHTCQPINPYGMTKLTVERILEDMNKFYGIRSISLRYFNAAGGDPRGLIKYYPRCESNLIPRLLNSINQASYITVNGCDYPTSDGTCVRDYIHIEDLGRAHISAMENLFAGSPSNCYNLGNGKGFSIREVIQAVEKVTGKKIKISIGPKRQGDPATLVSDAAKAARELHWTPLYPALESMIEHAWKARSSISGLNFP